MTPIKDKLYIHFRYVGIMFLLKSFACYTINTTSKGHKYYYK